MANSFDPDLYDQYRDDLANMSHKALDKLDANSPTKAKAIADERKERDRRG